ncbi:TadE-like protein [Actinoallomurus bryophytorum]|uniref:TadE-like protein n=1 Tax=Actinoallomurus bryophytorum TaxID=1490222 RepID=A0A543CHN5_9ACTN|nr:TadE family protein [Actinoallomurus bryophytorum]TQL96596.1 TadE-like protein [Actinoallomurus bryophytorum]
MRRRSRPGPKLVSFRGEVGNAVVEAAILAPLFILFLAGLLTGARLQRATAAVSQAAADAARQASIARTPAQARVAATASALATLRDKGLHCAPQVHLDLAAFSQPVGRAGLISASVTCTVRLADIAAPGIPGSRTVTQTHRSPLDPYRGRS